MPVLRQFTPAPGESYDSSEKPPPFGHPLKHYFALDEDYVNLNHGSYGSLPLPVIYAATKLSYEVERNPDIFHRFTYKPMLDKAREAVAKIIGADTDEVVLVSGATYALNTVLRNFEWREGDVILEASTTYGAVANTVRYLANRSEQPRPTRVTIQYHFPLTHAQILDRFRAKLREVKQASAHTHFTDAPPLSPAYSEELAGKGNKIVAVIDSITANPGAYMPWKEMVDICREEGVWSVVDVAHSIGQELDINLSETKPDFWFSNVHKWLYAKRGSAVLYVPKRNQHIIKSSIPTTHQYIPPDSPRYNAVGTNFVSQHDWLGAWDQTPFATIPAAIAFREWLGGEKAINDYCHQLALDGSKKLVEVLGTRDIDISGEVTLNMPNVQLPLPVESKPGDVYIPELVGKINATLQEKLLLQWKTYAAHFFHNGAWWCRCSAQVFNEVSDFEYLGKALNAICTEIKGTLLTQGQKVEIQG